MYLEEPKGQLISLTVACQLALLVITLPLQAADTGKKLTHPTPQTVSSTQKEPEGVVGKAVYYAKQYNGRRTSSGEIYDPEKLTAAHPTIPLGTRVKILNLANNRSVVVTVNDRCRKRSFEIIDLSREAAHKLGYLNKGTAMVRIIPIDK